MDSQQAGPRSQAEELEYLCVDAFLKSAVDAAGLKTALELGLIDLLRTQGPMALDEAERALGCERRGLALVLDLLRANHVVEANADGLTLTSAFRTALQYRDLLEAKIDFANFVVPDLVDRFTTLVADPGRFMSGSRMFDLFDYGRCFDPTPENYRLTWRWMRFTTALTRHEAGAILRRFDFGRFGRMLDVGGNSGEFALQLCRAHPGLRATVLDLPMVCELGRRHVGGELEADRIAFEPGNALEDPLPTGFDLVSFKSVLHDWPESETGRFLERAIRCLRPGGTILIAERGPVEVGSEAPSYAMIPMLLLFRSFRGPRPYRQWLEALGFRDIHVEEFNLEMPFFLVTARRPG